MLIQHTVNRNPIEFEGGLTQKEALKKFLLQRQVKYEKTAKKIYKIKFYVFSWKGQGQEGKLRTIHQMRSTIRKNLKRGIGIVYQKLSRILLMKKIILSKKTMKRVILIGIK